MSEESTCKGKLIQQDGSWKFVPDLGTECSEALQEMFKNLGPAGKCYVGEHIQPSDAKQKEEVDKAQESCY